VRRILVAGACVVVAVVTALLFKYPSRNPPNGLWNKTAIHATLERVVPAHNDLSFIYVLENRTDSDYRIAAESDVRIFGKSKSKSEALAKMAEHISGEFPLWVPARRKVHFALVWTAAHDIDPVRIGDFVNTLDVSSFVVFDQVRRYQIEFPAIQ